MATVMDAIERPGLPTAYVWHEWLDPGPDGRPLLLFNAFDSAWEGFAGGDPDDLYMAFLTTRDDPRSRAFVAEFRSRGWEPPDLDAIRPEVREYLDLFDELDRAQLARVVLDEGCGPGVRMLAYNFYLDQCSAEEMQARLGWMATLDPQTAADHHWRTSPERN